jgi:hypothetical protein
VLAQLGAVQAAPATIVPFRVSTATGRAAGWHNAAHGICAGKLSGCVAGRLLAF